MSIFETVEHAFLRDLFKVIDREIELKNDFIVSHPHEQTVYAESVGYLKALKDMKAAMLDIKKAYYP